jgi:LPS sulfotransferase NodH
MGDPREWYNLNDRRYRACDKYGIAFLERLAEESATPNGVFGVKVMSGSLGRFGVVAQWREIRARFSPQMIRLRRRDKVRQAISRYRAKRSGQWSRSPAALPPRPPEFDAAEIARNYNWLVAWEAQWDRMLRELSVEPRQIWYEDVQADPQSAVDSICRLLGVTAPSLDLSRCPLAIQRDELTEIWARRLTA